jgi:hypothetical protein
MKLLEIVAVMAALLSPASALSQGRQSTPESGDEYEISRSYETSQQASDGSSGSSNGRDIIIERVIAVRDGGLELEYDLPKGTAAEDRARQWQFPARVFQPASGPMQLLNIAELEARLEAWLKAAGLPRTACGRWIFTWNAFKIECDLKSVIEAIEAVDLRSVDLREGASYRDSEARGPGSLAKAAASAHGTSYTVTMDLDPEAVRRAKAESDVAVAEIMQKPVTLEAALGERAKESVSGTISVTFAADPAGNVRRRTKVIKIETQKPDGVTESETKSETVERSRTSR